MIDKSEINSFFLEIKIFTLATKETNNNIKDNIIITILEGKKWTQISIVSDKMSDAGLQLGPGGTIHKAI